MTELSAIVVTSCTVLYTIGSLCLWYLTYQNVKLIKQQNEIQNAAGRSAAWHNIIDSHRDLYLEVITNEELLKLYSAEAGLEAQVVRTKFLATLMINHALRIYLDYSNNLDIPTELQGYVNDLHSMLQFKFIRKRWIEIRDFYPASFKKFLDEVKVTTRLAG